MQWARTMARTAVGTSAKSPFVQVTRARSIEIKLDRKVLYEMDGGDREEVKKLEIEVEPGAIEVCVPAGGVSTATRVPETWELTGDHARETLLETGRVRLVVDAFSRLRYADGFSHSRSLAFAMALVLVQGLIALVGFASAFGNLELSRVIVDTIENAMPGLAGEILTDAVKQAREVGSKQRYLPLVLGLVGTTITATTALGQVERGVNRIYGIQRDRPALEKYGRAFFLALSVGFLFAVAFVLLAFGRDIGDEEGTVHTVWVVVRWPSGSPSRRSPCRASSSTRPGVVSPTSRGSPSAR